MIYLKLFWVFFQVGLLGIGGGYAAIPIIQSHVVDGQGWLTSAQFADLLAIDELTPGPIAINSATFVGMRVAGVGGALIATLGFVVPSVLIVSLLGFLYFRYRKLTIMQSIMKVLRPAVAAAIISAGFTLTILAFWGENGYSSKVVDLNIIAVFIFGLALYVLRKYKANPLFVILGTGGLGAVFYLIL